MKHDSAPIILVIIFHVRLLTATCLNKMTVPVALAFDVPEIAYWFKN